MTAGGESLGSSTGEAMCLTNGLKTRYNPKTTATMNITKTNLRFGNWNMQGLNSPGKIDILADECERSTRSCCID